MPLELPRPGAAVWIALAVVLVAALGFARVAGGTAHSAPVKEFPYLASEELRYDRTNAPASHEVLLLGSSLMRHGIIEEELPRELGDARLRAFNGGLDGASLWVILRFVRRIDRTRAAGPNVAVVEVNRRELDADRDLDGFARWELWRAGLDEDGVPGRSLAPAALARLARGALPPRQTLDSWVTDFSQQWLAYRVPRLVSTPAPQPRALWNASAIARRRAVRDMLPDIEARKLAGWRLSPAALYALHGIVSELHRRGYRVVLLETPMHTRYLATAHALPGDDDTERAYQSALRSPRVGADTVLDIHDAAALGATDSIFVDYGHLTRAGAEIQTRYVASFLARSGLLAPERATR